MTPVTSIKAALRVVVKESTLIIIEKSKNVPVCMNEVTSLMGDVSPEEEIKSWLVNTTCDSFILPHRISGYEIHIFLRRRRYNKFVSY